MLVWFTCTQQGTLVSNWTFPCTALLFYAKLINCFLSTHPYIYTFLNFSIPIYFTLITPKINSVTLSNSAYFLTLRRILRISWNKTFFSYFSISCAFFLKISLSLNAWKSVFQNPMYNIEHKTCGLWMAENDWFWRNDSSKFSGFCWTSVCKMLKES